jgi:hypothetical protein
MRRFTSLAGALALAAMLAACGTDGGAIAPLAELGADAEAAATDQGAAARIADRLFGAATGPDHRGVRLCMIGSGVIEIMVDRVAHADSDYAAAALGQIAAVEGVLTDLDSSAENLWFETDVKIVTLQLARVLVEAGKDRAPRLLGTLAGGINPLGLADRVGVAARQHALAEGVVLDTKRAVGELAGGRLAADQARAACMGRIDRNKGRILAILGAPQ